MVLWPCRLVFFASLTGVIDPYGVSRHEGPKHMKPMLRSQMFSVVMFLSALASSSLVIAAGQRWR